MVYGTGYGDPRINRPRTAKGKLMTLLFWIITAVCFVGWIYAEVRWRICKGGWANAIFWKNLMEENWHKLRVKVGELEKSRDYERRANEGGAVARSRLTVERDELRKTLGHAEECWRETERLKDELYKKYGTKCDALRECISQRVLCEMKLAHVETECNELRKTLARVAEAVRAERQASETTIRQLRQLFCDRCGTIWNRHVYDYLGDQKLRDKARKHYDSDNNQRVVRQIESSPEATTFLDEFVAEHLPGETVDAEGLPTSLCDLPDDEFFEDGLKTDTKEEWCHEDR